MEQILVADTEDLKDVINQSGLLTENVNEIIGIILEKHYYKERSIAEYCDTMKQIIPYAVIRRSDEIFVLERLNKQTEKRLHGKLSIGVGGHINPDAEKSDDPIAHGLFKELHEEISIQSIDETVCIGIINDLSTPVSSYHIGVLYEIRTKDDVSVLETEKMTGQWRKINELRALYDDMETWSQIVLDYLFE